jgi:hypothetical protein
VRQNRIYRPSKAGYPRLLDQVGSFETLVFFQHFMHFALLRKQATENGNLKATQKHFQDATDLNEMVVPARTNIQAPSSSVSIPDFLEDIQSELNRCALHDAVNEQRWND